MKTESRLRAGQPRIGARSGLAPALLPAPVHAVDKHVIDRRARPHVRPRQDQGKDFAAAKEELNRLAEDAQHPDVYNLLGFALRKTGDYATSLAYYTKALELEPDHRAAREYLGEALRGNR